LKDQQAFLTDADAYSCDLEPGEVLLMPAGWWHYVEYQDVSFSVAVRMGRNRYLRFLAEEIPVPSVDWLVLAQCFMDASQIDPDADKAFTALERAGQGHFADPQARALHFERLCAAICRELGLPTGGPPPMAADVLGRVALDAPRKEGGPVAGPSTRPRSFTPDSRVRLVEQAQLLVSLTAEGLVLAVGERLAGSISPDPAHPWTLGLLARVARRPGLTMAELAEGAGADQRVVAAFLGRLVQAGWVQPATDADAGPG